MLFVGARLLPRAVARSSATPLASQVRNLSLSAARRTVATPVLSQAAAKSSSTATKSRKSTTATTKEKKAAKKDNSTKASGTKKNKEKTASASADKKKKKKDKRWIKLDANGNKVPLPSELEPKRPGGAYLMYLTARFPSLQDKPEFSLTKTDGTRGVDTVKITRAVSEEWKAMSEADKQQHNDKFESATAQYLADHEKWKSSLTREDIERQNAFNRHLRTLKNRPKRIVNLADPHKPTRPPIPFWLWLYSGEAEQRPAGMTQSQYVSEQSRKYKALSEAEQGPYKEQYAKMREQYERALKKYQEGTSA
ncbi:hypothetical protein IE81DRAFT_322185 [Ceraceosorus guamensis]|uniref:HMG box domain-containing protein n=1 Tax=Ceraceosorus guamensis TaxID=1522189 RepID=A0A316W2P1_9BASI|nr:hypothetical protein IE81DRAFT_322185 [Ceraceosorus guamensis]PWN43764.1 hypothetical protein IE81DRAFT_322185 [Ceraceosorus guamensis]